MRKTMLKTVLAVVLISLFVIAFMYSAMATPPKDKIFFTWAPGGAAFYGAPHGKFVDGMFVWAANMISSTYGPFILAFVESYYIVGNRNTGVWHYVDHWYTDNVAAGQIYAALTVKVFTDAHDVYDSYDVTEATITMTSSSEDQLSVTVISSDGTGSFTASYWADTKRGITVELVGGMCLTSPIFLCGTKALRPLANAAVTGIPAGNFQHGQFRYTQTELYDPSLLENP